MSKNDELEKLIENFMDEYHEDLFALEQPFRDAVLSIYTRST